MTEGKRFLVDVGIRDLQFPIRCASREDSNGQNTIANISFNARIMQEFESRWLNKFIQILHHHCDNISTITLRKNIWDYYNELKANTVKISFEYPFFAEKVTPISKQKCLVKYKCNYTCKVSSIKNQSKIFFRMDIPIITTHPDSLENIPRRLFEQLSVITIETESETEVFPENLIDIVNKYTLAPVYSFLTEDDQDYLIEKIHSEQKHSVLVVDAIKEELARNRDLDWFSVKSANHSILYPYKTLIDT